MSWAKPIVAFLLWSQYWLKTVHVTQAGPITMHLRILLGIMGKRNSLWELLATILGGVGNDAETTESRTESGWQENRLLV